MSIKISPSHLVLHGYNHAMLNIVLLPTAFISNFFYIEFLR